MLWHTPDCRTQIHILHEELDMHAYMYASCLTFMLCRYESVPHMYLRMGYIGRR